MILLCYDGSDDSRSAIEHAGGLLAGQPTTVLTVWETFMSVLSRTASGLATAGAIVDIDQIDEANRQSAEKLAEEGAQLAREAGLDARPRSIAQESTTAAAILGEAEAVGANAIAMGSRGLTGVKSLLLGSVSHAVIQHADRTVIVVPSPQIAAERQQQRHARRAQA